MANTNSPFGFKPIRRLDGAAWSSCHTTKRMQITAGACNRGDVVKQLADGTVAVATVLGGAGNLGIFVGCHYMQCLDGLADLEQLLAGCRGYGGHLGRCLRHR